MFESSSGKIKSRRRKGKFQQPVNGGNGIDTLELLAGDELFEGGITQYVVDLASGTGSVIGDFPSGFTLSGIENVQGSNVADLIVGDANANVLQGNEGNDTIRGGAGNDTLSGSESNRNGEFDTVSYIDSTAGVVVNLGPNALAGGTYGGINTAGIGPGQAYDGFGGTDVLSNFDCVIGSDYGDILIGGSNSMLFNGVLFESFVGGAGDDFISGGVTSGVNSADYDRVDYSGATAAVNVNLNTGVATGDASVGTDTLVDINMVLGSAYNDTLTGGNALNDNMEVFEGGDGDDTINGGSGFDRADYTNTATSGVVVNLSASTLLAGTYGGIVLGGDVLAGTATDGLTGTDTLINIEGAKGSSYDDILIGADTNSYYNFERFEGMAGNDYIDGRGGTDLVAYVNERDANGDGLGVVVNLGSTQLAAGSWYGDAYAAVAAGTALDAYGTTDTLLNMEQVLGTIYNDVIIGNDANNTLNGYLGNDLLRGGVGNDTLNGGSANMGEFDTADYSTSTAGIAVKLGNFVGGATVAAGTYGGIVLGSNLTAAGNQTGTAFDGLGGTDTLNNIDFVIGSAYNDILVGGSTSQIFNGTFFESFVGGAGNDFIAGGVTSGVYLYDFDRVDYSGATAGVNVNFNTGVATGNASVGTDTLVDINMVLGSAYNDTLTGGNAGNDTLGEFFQGGAGNDIINGGTGWDRADYDYAPAGVVANISATTLLAGTYGGIVLGGNVAAGTALDGYGNTDTLTSIEGLRGSAFDDILIGSDYNVTQTFWMNAAESFEGMGGNDYIDGRGGRDRVDYFNGLDANGDGFGVVVNLDSTLLSGGTWQGVDYAAVNPGQALDSYGGTDTLFNIEDIRGSIYDDVLIGNSGNNEIYGEAGDDIIGGHGGNDTLRGGAGNDILSGNNTVINGEFDTADYGSSGSGIVVKLGAVIGGNLAAGTYGGIVTGGVNGNQALDGFGGTDTLLNIDAVVGSAYNDILVGGSTSMTFNGMYFESFVGGAGNDFIAGGVTSGVFLSDFDQVDYSGATAAVNVNLNTGVATGDASVGTDTLVDINVVLGSAYNDTLTGGNVGNDTFAELFQGGAGNDLINGGTGFDRADYHYSPAGVVANISAGALAAGTYGGIVLGTSVAAGTARDGYGGIDTLISIEALRGGAFNDILIGSDFDVKQAYWLNAAESFQGMAGNDYIDGRGGRDQIDYFNDIDLNADGLGVVVNLGSTVLNAGNLLGVGYGSVVAGKATDGWGGADTLLNIENVRASIYNDVIVGNSGNNEILGMSGHDSIVGGAGNDTLDGGSGNDTILGGDGHDVLVGGLGNDVLDGGTGWDTADYSTNGGGAVTVNMTTGNVNDGQGGLDTLTNIVRVIGAAGTDTFLGSDYAITGTMADNLAVQFFMGGAGNDTITGSALNGRMTIAEYTNSTSGVTVDLSTGTATDGFGGTDTLNDVDGVRGSAYGDALTGGSASTTSGGTLLEWFEGMGGDDTINGGAGYDMASYQNATGAVNVNLATGTATGDASVGTDTLSNIEMVRGSAFGDVLTGSANAAGEFFEGKAGNDTIDGGAGFDRVDFRHSATTGVVVNLAAATLAAGTYGGITLAAGVASLRATDGEGGTDVLANIEGTQGSDFNDIMIGADTNAVGYEMFEGMAGNDYIDGRGGYDIAAYHNGYDLNADGLGVVVNLGTTALAAGSLLGVNYASVAAGKALDSYGGTDTLLNIEAVRGSIYNDVIVGNAAANNLDGWAGDDSIVGGDGNDTLLGNDGNDTLLGGAGADNLQGGAGDDLLNGGGVPVALGLRTDPADVLRGDAGDDTLDGGSAQASVWAFADYSSSTGAVNVNLGTGIASDGFGGTDTLANIDGVFGSANNDVLTGGSNSTYITTQFEFFQGGLGDDTIDGGDGMDVASYQNASGSVVVDLSAGTATGADGNDSLFNIEQVRGSMYADTLTGSAVNDQFEGMGGNDVIDGGDGVDIIRYMRSGAAVNVDLGAGTATDGFGGTDTFSNIEGVRGSDFNDTLTGGAGDEIFQGMAGNDIISGGAGSDTVSYNMSLSGVSASLVTNTASDGFGGVDTLINIENLQGSSFNDALAGNAGANRLEGLEGNDALDGGAGNDTLLGGAGNDSLQGGAGADELDAGTGVDIVDGGTEADTLVVLGNFADYTITRPSGTETRFINDVTGENILVKNVESVQFLDGLKTIEETWENNPSPFNDLLTGTGGNDTLDGQAGNDTLVGLAGNDTLIGGAGIDSLVGGDGDDSYVVDVAGDVIVENVGEGTDQVNVVFAAAGTYVLSDNVENAMVGSGATIAVNLTGNAGANALLGNAAANTLMGLGGDDMLDGAAGNDNLQGGEGNDRLDGGAGVDTLIGGAGDDTYVIDVATDVVNETVAGSGGTDTVEVAFAAAGSYTLTANVENATITTAGLAINVTGNASDNQITGNDGNNSLVGAAGNDTLTGGAGNDTLQGGAGNDQLTGGAGNDVYIVDAAGDTVTELADEGTDRVQTTLATYTLGDHVENLTYTGAAAFTGTGHALGNVIQGGAGHDLLDGGVGNDTLIGGLGNDIYTVDSLGDVVTEAAAGTDTIRTDLAAYSLAPWANVENLTYIGGGDFAGTGNAAANWLVGGAGNDTLDGGAGVDRLEGGAGDDIYVVDVATDVVVENLGEGTDLIRTALASYSLAAIANVENLTYTGVGNFTGTGNALDNVITGGAGNDTLNGGAGNDLLVGSAGNDTLDGGAGNDQLMGGAGNDVYIVDAAGDTVTELAGEGTDLIRTGLANFSLAGIAHVENLTYTGAAAFTGTGNTFDNVITGGAGNDWLDGGTGNDTLIGGLGNDIYTVDALGDVVVEAAASGTDRVETAVLGSYTLAANVENLTYTGAGNFVGTGNALNNVLQGGAQYDQLFGLAGNDTLIGGLGDDFLDGGDGSDTYRFNLGDGVDVIDQNDTVVGSIDTLELTGANPVSAIAPGDVAVLRGYYTENDLVLRIEKFGEVNQVVIADFFNGDAISAGTIDKVVFTGGDANVANDITWTAAQLAQFALTGNGDDNFIKGYATNDVLTGNGGNDTLIGGAGNDTLNGGTGDDALFGGIGNDTYLLGIGGGHDVITELDNAGTDVLRVTGGVASGDATLTRSGDDLLVGNGNGDEARVAGFFTSNASTIEQIVFDDGTIWTAAQIRYLVTQPTDGDDTITGYMGADRLSGGAGDDVLYGMGGNDTLIGGDGADTLTGGLGADRFVFNTADALVNADTIMDFVSGTDKIVLDNDVFTVFGATTVSANQFVSGAGAVALDADDFLVYDTDTGALYYDADGSGAGAAVQIATLGVASHPALIASDFSIVL